MTTSLYHLLVRQDRVKPQQLPSRSFFNYIQYAEKHEDWKTDNDDDNSALFSLT